MSERLEAGSIVDARYRIESRLGAGGMAEVYCAEDLQLGRKVALKVLYRRFAQDEEFVERFRREASSAAGLQHQHVVAVYDRGQFDGTYYIAMEYLDGRSLKQLINEEAPLEPSRAIDLTVQILRAARFAHRRGIIHRDLKPHNVIVDADDRAKVTDFGIARAGASDMTQTGSIMGTAQYLSPEQAQGLPVSERSDLYSVGIMLYEMLTGRLPFDGESAVSIALKHVSEVPPHPRAGHPAISEGLDAVVMRSLAKDPAQRFPDADAFIAALEAADSGDPQAAGALPTDITHFLGRTGSPLPATAADVAAAYQTGVHDATVGAVVGQEDEGRWWLWLVALLAVVGIAVAAVLLLSGGKKIAVPSVVGADLSNALIALHNKGFTTTDTPTISSKPVDQVVGSLPTAGTELSKGDNVELFVSSGPRTATIPAVAGLARSSAREALKEAGFKHVSLSYIFDHDVKTNHVIRAQPPEGQTEATSFPITLFISRGTQRVKIPDETGKTQANAVLDLRNQGLRYGISPMPSSEDPGTVISQDPKPSAYEPKGTVVTLTVASRVEVPDVSTTPPQTQLTARVALAKAGFVVAVTQQQTSDPTENLRVLDQSPAGGTPLRKGATVTITVGMYVKPPKTTPTKTTPPPPTTPPPTDTTPTVPTTTTPAPTSTTG